MCARRTTVSAAPSGLHWRRRCSGFLQVAYGILRERVFHAGAMCAGNPRSVAASSDLFLRVQGASDARIPTPFPRLARDRLRGRDHAHGSLAGAGAGRYPYRRRRADAIPDARGVHGRTGGGPGVHRGGDAWRYVYRFLRSPISRPCIPSWRKKSRITRGRRSDLSSSSSAAIRGPDRPRRPVWRTTGRSPRTAGPTPSISTRTPSGMTAWMSPPRTSSSRSTPWPILTLAASTPGSFVDSVESWRAIDDDTFEMVAKEPTVHVPL